MKKSKQLLFAPVGLLPKKFFGGVLMCGRRKSIRPLSTKDSIHFVLRSTWATGPDSFLAKRNEQAIDQIITHFAKKFGVRIYRQAINSNHLHLLLKISHRSLYTAFVKAIAGQIASHVMRKASFKQFVESRARSVAGDGVSDLNQATKTSSFWQYRPFSRVVSWGRDFRACVSYLKQNVLEAVGFVPYKTRTNPYAQWIIKAAAHRNFS